MTPIRVVTWNLHGCVGARGVFDPGRTVAALCALKPQIAALQEVDTWNRGTAFDGFSLFCRHTGPHAAEARAISDGRGDYGHMVTSAWPLARTEIHDVSVRGREPRMILETYAALPGGTLRVIAAHFGLRPRERRRQIAALRAVLERDPETPSLLMGDFNDWPTGGAVHRAVAPMFGSPGAPATFPARRPLFALDRIWCRPAELVERVWAARDVRGISDHLPLVADLAWP